MFGAPELAVRLVNSEHRADGVDDLLDLADLRGLLAAEPDWAARARPADHQAMRRARGRLRQVFSLAAAGEDAGAVRLLNALLQQSTVRPVLDIDTETPRLRLVGESSSVAADYLARAVLGLAEVVDSAGVRALGMCAAPGCLRALIDPSARRRFCSERCAGRVHVAAHRARLASASS